jgi:hypothetical protein
LSSSLDKKEHRTANSTYSKVVVHWFNKTLYPPEADFFKLDPSKTDLEIATFAKPETVILSKNHHAFQRYQQPYSSVNVAF